MRTLLQMYFQRHHSHDIFTWHSRLLLHSDATLPIYNPPPPLHPTQQLLYLQGVITNNHLTNQSILKHSRLSTISLIDIVDTLFNIQVDTT